MRVEVQKRCLYVGLREDPEARRRTKARLPEQINSFFQSPAFKAGNWRALLHSWPKRTPSMAYTPKLLAWRQLHDSVFAEGRELAEVQRARFKDAEARAEEEARRQAEAAKRALTYVKGQVAGAEVPPSPSPAAAPAAPAATAAAWAAAGADAGAYSSSS